MQIIIHFPYIFAAFPPLLCRHHAGNPYLSPTNVLCNACSEPSGFCLRQVAQRYSKGIRFITLLGGADTVFLPLQRENAPGYSKGTGKVAQK